MDDKGLTLEDKEILYRFLSSLNYYELMAIISKINTNEENMKNTYNKLIRIITKLYYEA